MGALLILLNGGNITSGFCLLGAPDAGTGPLRTREALKDSSVEKKQKTKPRHARHCRGFFFSGLGLYLGDIS